MNNKLKILIAEDDVIISFVISKMINQLGHHCIGVASSEDEAVQLALESNPDIVIMDLSLLEGNGLDAAKKIKQSLFNTAVLFTSGSAKGISDSDYISHPAHNFLPKPFLFEDLKKRIEWFVSNSIPQ